MFYGLTGLIVATGVPGGPIPVLLVAAAAVWAYFRRFDRHDLWRAGPLRGALPGMLGRWALFSVLAVVGVAVFDPQHLFDLPRRQPWLWLAVLVLYPLLSVYPQEPLSRAFLLRRYAPLFGAGRGAAAVAFGEGFRPVRAGRDDPGRRGYRTGVIPTCPICGATGVPLLFGLPVPEAVAAAEAGRLALGGCVLPAEPPNWQCPRRHRWRDPDESGWDGRLLAVLVAHGYVDVESPLD